MRPLPQPKGRSNLRDIQALTLGMSRVPNTVVFVTRLHLEHFTTRDNCADCGHRLEDKA